MEVKGSEAQRCHREVGSEGSVEQRYGPMHKNRMRDEHELRFADKKVKAFYFGISMGSNFRGPEE
jgi:hypothetical protein